MLPLLSAGDAFIGLFFFFIIILSLASFAITVWAAVDIATKDFRTSKQSDKPIWLILVLLLAPISGIVYLVKRKDLLDGGSASPLL